MEKTDLRLIDIQSGGKHNAIPRAGYAVCAVPFEKKEAVRMDLNLSLIHISHFFIILLMNAVCVLLLSLVINGTKLVQSWQRSK